MKWNDYHNPNHAVEPRLPREHMPITVDDAVRQRLAEKAKAPKPGCPGVVELLDQLPEVVAWLRDRMTGRDRDDAPVARSAAKSKPPFRIAYMDAADREVAALVYWCDQYGVPLDGRIPVYGVNGRVLGVRPAPWMLAGLKALCNDLALYIPVEDLDDGDVLHHPKYGLWSVRSNHYAIWPDLGAKLMSDYLAEQKKDSAPEEELTLWAETSG